MTDQNDPVDRLPDPPDPGGRGPQTTSRKRQQRAAREAAAADLDAQLDSIDVTPSDVELSLGDDGTFEASVTEEVRR